MSTKAINPEDKVFQISCYFSREGEESESFLLTLKSATAAENIAISTGRFSCVALNISSAVSTLIKFIHKLIK